MTATFATPTRQSADIHLRWIGRLVGMKLTGTSGGPQTKTLGLVSGAVVLWASWPALATAVGPAPPFLTLGASALIGFLFSLLLAARKGAAHTFLSLPFKTMVFVALGLMGNNAFYIAAIGRIGPAEANVVHYLWPVFLVLLASMLQQRLPSLLQALGVAFGFVGVAVALYPQMAGSLDGIGVLLGVFGALTFAVYSVGRSLARIETNVVGPSLGLAGLAALSAHICHRTCLLAVRHGMACDRSHGHRPVHGCKYVVGQSHAIRFCSGNFQLRLSDPACRHGAAGCVRTWQCYLKHNCWSAVCHRRSLVEFNFQAKRNTWPARR